MPRTFAAVRNEPEGNTSVTRLDSLAQLSLSAIRQFSRLMERERVERGITVLVLYYLCTIHYKYLYKKSTSTSTILYSSTIVAAATPAATHSVDTYRNTVVAEHRLTEEVNHKHCNRTSTYKYRTFKQQAQVSLPS
jgi:hypothetical protein